MQSMNKFMSLFLSPTNKAKVLKKKCKAVNCDENHPSHYCKKCKDADADHRSQQCTNEQNSQMNYTSRSSNLEDIQKCKAVNCQENHASHYCRNCKDTDADHRSGQCTKECKVLAKCKVKGCRETHQKHYCTMCEKVDVDHYARNCLQTKTLYHGTTQQIAKIIKKEGFKSSKKGNLGEGVYFTDDKQIAGQIGTHRAQQRKNKEGVGVILKCVVPCKFLTTDYQQHGTWDQVTDGPFQEYVVRNAKKIRHLHVQEA